MALFRFKSIITSMAGVLYFTTLPIAVLISVTTLALTGTPLTSATVFTLVVGLVTLRTTFCYNLSLAMHNVADAKVAIDRMQTFLNDEVTKPEKLKLHKTRHKLSTTKLNVDDGLALHVESRKKDKSVELTSYNKREESPSENCQNVSIDNISLSNLHEVPLEPQVKQEGSTPKEPHLFIYRASCSWNQDYYTKTLNNISLHLGCADSMLAITGAVGSGKSSLLTAIIGELPLCEGKISYHGRVAYVPQIPWVFSGTIRENILFGRPFEQEKFQTVIEVCSLTKDLAAFSKGDLTEIGQRGVTLSGGQKARVGLARAVYSDADIYLLDDPLSAVDIKVGRQLFEDCIVSHLSGRIRLLVTHQLQYLKDVDQIAVMENGSIIYQGGYNELKDNNSPLGTLELPEPLKNEYGLTGSASLDDCNEEAVITEVNRSCSIPSVEFTQQTRGRDNLAFEGDLELLNDQQDENCDNVNMNLQTTNSPRPETSLFKSIQRPVLDLKEEEESKTTGTVSWRVYWNYFKEALPIPSIMLLTILLILAQGKNSLKFVKLFLALLDLNNSRPRASA